MPEIEVAAIYFALQKFEDFIYDQKVIIKPDNISLAFLQKGRLTSSRISNDIHEITSHNVEFQHIVGAGNIFADLLNRLSRTAYSLNRLENHESREVVIKHLNVKEKLNLGRMFKDLKQQQQSVPKLRDIAQKAPEIG